MVWAPKSSFAGVMEDIVLPNIKTIVERDFKDALDYYYPNENYEDFKEITLGQIKKKEFPLLAIGPVGNPAVESQDSARFTQPLQFVSFLGVIADDADTVTELITKYVKVYHGVLHAANKSDYFGTMNSRVFGWSIEIEHLYGPIRSNRTQFFRDATVNLAITCHSR